MRKKWMVGLLCLCVAGLCGGCHTQPIPIPSPQNGGNRAPAPITGVLPKGRARFTFADAQVRLPERLEDMEAMGFALSDNQRRRLMETELEPGGVSEPFMLEKGGELIVARLYNASSTARSALEGVVAAISFTGGGKGEADVGVGSTEEEIIQAYGEMDEGRLTERGYWMQYGTWLYEGFGFEIDGESRRVIRIASFYIPFWQVREGEE